MTKKTLKETKKSKELKNKTITIKKPEDHEIKKLLSTIDKLNDKIDSLDTKIEEQKELELDNRKRINEADTGGKGYSSMYDVFMYNAQMFEKILKKTQMHYLITTLTLYAFLVCSVVFGIVFGTSLL